MEHEEFEPEHEEGLFSLNNIKSNATLNALVKEKEPHVDASTLKNDHDMDFDDEKGNKSDKKKKNDNEDDMEVESSEEDMDKDLAHLQSLEKEKKDEAERIRKYFSPFSHSYHRFFSSYHVHIQG